MASGVDRQEPKILRWLVLILFAAGALVAAILARRWRLRVRGRQLRSRIEPRPSQPQAMLQLEGLTEAESAARQVEGQDNAVPFKPPQSKEEILRSTIFTVFNLSMLGLVVVQVLPVDTCIRG